MRDCYVIITFGLFVSIHFGLTYNTEHPTILHFKTTILSTLTEEDKDNGHIRLTTRDFPYSQATDVMLKEVSLCIRFKQTTTPHRMSLLEIGKLIYILWNRQGIVFTAIRGRSYLVKSDALVMMQWHHFCLSFSKSFQNNSLHLVLNGKLLYDDLHNLPDLNMTTKDLNALGLTLGLYNNSHHVVHSAKYLYFKGYLSELYIWSHALPIKFMTNITASCTDARSYEVRPDIFDYHKVNWENYVQTKSHVDLVKQEDRMEFCTSPSDKQPWLIPRPLDFDSAKLNCQGLGGHMWAPHSQDDVEKGVLFAKSFKTDVLSEQCNNRLWSGIMKADFVNQYIDTLGNNVTYLNWAEGQPNGRDAEPCIVLSSSKLK